VAVAADSRCPAGVVHRQARVSNWQELSGRLKI
jgi:hypothetical protein